VPSKYLARASVARFVTVCGAAGFKAIVMVPQLVLIVIFFASFLSTVVGCLSVAGACAFEVGLAQPATDVGRSAADELTTVKEDAAIAKAQSVESLFNFIPILFLCECTFHSHSIVPGGLLVTSKTTRFTSRTSFVIRVEIFSKVSYGTRDQSAVIASSLETGRSTIGWP